MPSACVCTALCACSSASRGSICDGRHTLWIRRRRRRVRSAVPMTSRWRRDRCVRPRRWRRWRLGCRSCARRRLAGYLSPRVPFHRHTWPTSDCTPTKRSHTSHWSTDCLLFTTFLITLFQDYLYTDKFPHSKILSRSQIGRYINTN